MSSVQILYKDQDLLVCVKPAGLAVQTARLTDQDLVSLLKNLLAAAGENTELHIVHRLDQPVEGILVLARNSRAAAFLDRQAADPTGRAMRKEYLAVISGLLKETDGELWDYLLRDGRSNCSRVVSASVKGAKKSGLKYQVETSYPEQDRSLVRIHLKTGRHHQIRVQMAHIGHPLIGDRRYAADDGQTAAQKNGQGLPLMLCACSLSFTAPSGQKHHYEIRPSWLSCIEF